MPAHTSFSFLEISVIATVVSQSTHVLRVDLLCIVLRVFLIESMILAVNLVDTIGSLDELRLMQHNPRLDSSDILQPI